jgi:hypothetical protein
MELQECLTIDLELARKRARKIIKETEDNEPLGSPERLRRLGAKNLIDQVDTILKEREESCED